MGRGSRCRGSLSNGSTCTARYLLLSGARGNERSTAVRKHHVTARTGCSMLHTVENTLACVNSHRTDASTHKYVPLELQRPPGAFSLVSMVQHSSAVAAGPTVTGCIAANVALCWRLHAVCNWSPRTNSTIAASIVIMVRLERRFVVQCASDDHARDREANGMEGIFLRKERRYKIRVQRVQTITTLMYTIEHEFKQPAALSSSVFVS